MKTIGKAAWALCIGLAAAATPAAVYYVDGAATNAADANPGSASQPWKTLARAGGAKELQPGDTVLVNAGVYREHLKITVSGEPQRPLTFAAAPGAKVVIKGSEVITGEWTEVTDDPGLPGALGTKVWKIRLGDEFFKDAPCYLSQVFVQDDHPLQLIGPDAIYSATNTSITVVGRDRKDMILNSFFFDPADRTLYIRIGGFPNWFTLEAGVRPDGLTVGGAHDVIVRGFEVRHNRQPGGQWPMACVSGCARVTVEDCRFEWSDFCGFAVSSSTNCTVRRCDLSHNGNTGLTLYLSDGVVVEDCTLLFNNYRRFVGWHSGGMKNIPNNKRSVVRRCEVAYTLDGIGIWFDTNNEDVRILDNVIHHNDDAGIYFEVNKGGGGSVIANNLVYANRARGIYLSGSRDTWVVHNTVAGNQGGIVVMPASADWPVCNDRVYNNLLLGNVIPSDQPQRGADLILYRGTNAADPAVAGTASDGNVFAASAWGPRVRAEWNNDLTLEQWRQQWGLDRRSRILPVNHERVGTGFRLITKKGLNVAVPLPDELSRLWKPKNPKRVGADRAEWLPR